MSVRRTNTFQSISPRTVVFHVPLTRSNPLLIPTPFVCLPIFVGRAISPGYFSISFDESTSVRAPLPLRAFFSSSMSNSGWHKFDKFLLFSIFVACEQGYSRHLESRWEAADGRLVGATQLAENGRGLKSVVWRSGEISVARLRSTVGGLGGCAVDVIGTSG